MRWEWLSDRWPMAIRRDRTDAKTWGAETGTVSVFQLVPPSPRTPDLPERCAESLSVDPVSRLAGVRTPARVCPHNLSRVCPTRDRQAEAS